MLQLTEITKVGSRLYDGVNAVFDDLRMSDRFREILKENGDRGAYIAPWGHENRIECLRTGHEPAALRTLVRWLQDDKKAVYALEVLAGLDNPEVADRVEKLTVGERTEVRSRALAILASGRDCDRDARLHRVFAAMDQDSTSEGITATIAIITSLLRGTFSSHSPMPKKYFQPERLSEGFDAVTMSMVVNLSGEKLARALCNCLFDLYFCHESGVYHGATQHNTEAMHNDPYRAAASRVAAGYIFANVSKLPFSDRERRSREIGALMTAVPSSNDSDFGAAVDVLKGLRTEEAANAIYVALQRPEARNAAECALLGLQPQEMRGWLLVKALDEKPTDSEPFYVAAVRCLVQDGISAHTQWVIDRSSYGAQSGGRSKCGMIRRICDGVIGRGERGS